MKSVRSFSRHVVILNRGAKLAEGTDPLGRVMSGTFTRDAVWGPRVLKFAIDGALPRG